MRSLGGIPVRRDRRENLVSTLAGLFEGRDQLGLVVPAEGTRSYVDHWKSGFYHIARQAGVPIVMSYLDYARRRGGFGPAFAPSGDIKADMDIVRAFYADKKGLYPELFGTIRLLEESESAAEPEQDQEG
jgi:1-acyl-sn-glycerol-3-phosphate acyltransferase